jgi:hypothetical protein
MHADNYFNNIGVYRIQGAIAFPSLPNQAQPAYIKHLNMEIDEEVNWIFIYSKDWYEIGTEFNQPV